MIPPHLTAAFDQITGRVASPFSLLASLEGSDGTVATLTAYVARRSGVSVTQVAAVFDACIESNDEMPTHDVTLDDFEW